MEDNAGGFSLTAMCLFFFRISSFTETQNAISKSRDYVSIT